jgi:hypothetical protein
MKVRILRKNDKHKVDEELLVEPSGSENDDYVMVLKDLWDDIILLKDSLTEENDDVKSYCNKNDYYQLRDILIKLNALSMASKGKLIQNKK